MRSNIYIVMQIIKRTYCNICIKIIYSASIQKTKSILTAPPSNIVGLISRKYAHVHIINKMTVKRLEKSKIALIL